MGKHIVAEGGRAAVFSLVQVYLTADDDIDMAVGVHSPTTPGLPLLVTFQLVGRTFAFTMPELSTAITCIDTARRNPRVDEGQADALGALVMVMREAHRRCSEIKPRTVH